VDEESRHGRRLSGLSTSLLIAPLLSAKGIVSYLDKDYAEAIPAFQLSINEDPTLGAPYVGLGAVLIIQRRFREALARISHTR
jgi:tetratricopeptide (TPR) repeat protein